MPYTPAQRRLFHEMEENPDAARRHGTSQREAGQLADEADRLKRQGKEKKAGFIDLSSVFDVTRR